MTDDRSRLRQAALAVGVLALAGALAFGAADIPSDAGYAGVGPNFLPWLVSAVLAACSLAMLWEVRSGGFRGMLPPDSDEPMYVPGFVWLSAGMLLNAALLTTIGFILSCTLCYAFAVRGLRNAEGGRDNSPRAEGGLDNSPRRWLIDAFTGAAIAAPVFWLFTKLLAINLPGLTSSGWL
jgi:putative tricarboxylic transport membrane protein